MSMINGMHFRMYIHFINCINGERAYLQAETKKKESMALLNRRNNMAILMVVVCLGHIRTRVYNIYRLLCVNLHK